MSIKVIEGEDFLKYIEYVEKIKFKKSIMERQNGISILDEKGIIYNYKESEPEEALYLQEDTVEYKYDYEEEEKETSKSYTKKHDKLFRDSLDDKTEVIKFIKYFLEPKTKLKEASIEKYNRNFITIEYKERQSDIVYKVKNKNIFILIEHQSKIDNAMPFRFVEYITETMKSAIDRNKIRNKNYKLPKIVPILLYTGEKPWDVSEELVEEEYKAFEEFGLQLKYNIIDINDYTEKELLEKDSIVALAMAIEKCEDDDTVEEILERLVEISITENRKELAKRIITNILKTTLDRINPNITEKVLRKLKESEVKENMRPLDVRIQEGNERKMKQILKEGRKEGRKEGIKEGRKEGILSIAANMIKEKVDSDFILKMTGLKQDELEKLAKEIN